MSGSQVNIDITAADDSGHIGSKEGEGNDNLRRHQGRT